MIDIDNPNALHSSASNEHYTPAEIIEAARETMGKIDLDPATTTSVNRFRVRATEFFTRKDGSLSRPWHGRVWLNPPGGRAPGNKSSAAVWWAKLAEEYAAGRVTEALFLGFSIEILATSQDAAVWIGDLPFCIPRKRIEFDRETSPGTFVAGDSPTHSNVIAYLPPRHGSPAAVERFAAAFNKFGRVSI
jgi:hypothetical protein